MADAILLKNARPMGGQAVDVPVEGGRFPPAFAGF